MSDESDAAFALEQARLIAEERRRLEAEQEARLREQRAQQQDQ